MSITRIKQPTKVLRCWRFTIRGLSMEPAGRRPFYMRSASYLTTEREAVAEIKQRFTTTWWDEHIIQEVTDEGYVHMIDGVALYDED